MSKKCDTEALLRTAHDEALRKELAFFIRACFAEMNPDTHFLPNWHIDLIASELMDCFRGKTKRLIINMPPRSIKSICTSVALTAFFLGHRPSASIINTSYGEGLVEDFARAVRKVMTSPWYQRAFKTRLTSENCALDNLTTTSGGQRIAVSAGGILTGRGADLIVMDDPLKPADAHSEVNRKKINDWFDGTLYSRLNNKNEGVIILVMQRLHEDDLTGHLLERDGWKLLSLPAIASEDEIHHYTILGRQETHFRRKGEALHPGFESLEALAKTREILGSYHFNAQYLQDPAPSDGGMILRAWLPRFDPNCPPAFAWVFQSWDTANKTGELNDFSVCTTWGFRYVGGRPTIYLLHVHRERMDYPTLRKKVIELQRRHSARYIIIEDKASGTQLLQDLKQDLVIGLTQYDPKGQDKLMRLHASTGAMEAGQVLLPQTAPWLADFEKELFGFPGSKFDDQVDSTSQAIHWVSNNKWNIWAVLGQNHLDSSRIAPRS